MDKCTNTRVHLNEEKDRADGRAGLQTSPGVPVETSLVCGGLTGRPGTGVGAMPHHVSSVGVKTHQAARQSQSALL